MTLLSIGPPNTVLQNIVYALPANTVRIHASAAVEISFDGTTWDALTNSETVGAEAASGFLRCTSANATVFCKRY